MAKKKTIDLTTPFSLSPDLLKRRIRDAIRAAAQRDWAGAKKKAWVKDTILSWLDEEVFDFPDGSLKELGTDAFLAALEFFIDGLIQGEFELLRQQNQA